MILNTENEYVTAVNAANKLVDEHAGDWEWTAEFDELCNAIEAYEKLHSKW